MKQEEITPHKITKPFQLLAAWLVGLVSLDGIFIAGASISSLPDWVKATLVISAVVNVLLFLIAIFVLQTKYRPEMQEDTYYSQYLDKKTNKIISIPKEQIDKSKASHSINRIVELEHEISRLRKHQIQNDTETSKALAKWKIAINDNLKDYAEIRKAIKNAGLRIESIFGQVNGTEPPDKEIITFNQYMDFLSIREILSVLLPFNFDGINLSDPVPEIDPEDVYIGSYGYESGYAPITDELRTIIDTPLEYADFVHYMKMYTKIDT